jgi:hypothetical protein
LAQEAPEAESRSKDTARNHIAENRKVEERIIQLNSRRMMRKAHIEERALSRRQTLLRREVEAVK